MTGVAIRMLNGEVPAKIKTSPQLPGRPVYDWRELSRWNIGADRLPPESIVLFRDPGVWERYKSYIAIGGGIVAVQSLLIVALLAKRPIAPNVGIGGGGARKQGSLERDTRNRRRRYRRYPINWCTLNSEHHYKRQLLQATENQSSPVKTYAGSWPTFHFLRMRPE